MRLSCCDTFMLCADSRPTEHCIRRRRWKCLKCNKRNTTYEIDEETYNAMARPCSLGAKSGLLYHILTSFCAQIEMFDFTDGVENVKNNIWYKRIKEEIGYGPKA